MTDVMPLCHLVEIVRIQNIKKQIAYPALRLICQPTAVAPSSISGSTIAKKTTVAADAIRKETQMMVATSLWR